MRWGDGRIVPIIHRAEAGSPAYSSSVNTVVLNAPPQRAVSPGHRCHQQLLVDYAKLINGDSSIGKK